LRTHDCAGEQEAIAVNVRAIEVVKDRFWTTSRRVAPVINRAQHDGSRTSFVYGSVNTWLMLSAFS